MRKGEKGSVGSLGCHVLLLPLLCLRICSQQVYHMKRVCLILLEKRSFNNALGIARWGLGRASSQLSFDFLAQALIHGLSLLFLMPSPFSLCQGWRGCLWMCHHWWTSGTT